MMNAKGRPQWRSSLWGVLLFALVSLFSVGCGGSDGDNVIVDDFDDPTGGGFSITAPGVTDNKVTVEVGETLQFGPEGVKWTSSKPEFAAISESGLLEAKAEGETVITATNTNGRAADNSVTVRVVPVVVPNQIFLNLEPSTVEIGLGGNARAIGIYGTGTSATYKDITSQVNQWTSSTGDVEITGSAYTGKRLGSSNLTPVFRDARFTPLLFFPNKTVFVNAARSDLTGLSINFTGPVTGSPRRATVNLGTVSRFTAEGIFQGVSGAQALTDEVIWVSSDRSIGFVLDTGEFLPLKKGETTIKATRLTKVGGTLVESDSIIVTVQ